MKLINNVTIGSDPEIFLIDSKTGEAVSSEGLIGGSKDNPISISDKGHALQEDNVMVEFNIPPVIDADSFVRELNYCLGVISKGLPSNVKIDITSSKEFSKKQLSTEQACMFGCSIDFNAYTMLPNEAPQPPEKLRYAGGHIHVGYDNVDIDTSQKIIQAMDLFLGIPAVLLDDDVERKSFYGTAGRWRPTDYGIEYRTLSNFWLKTEKSMKWAFNQTIKAIEFLNNQNNIINEDLERIQNAINTNNQKLAKQIIKEYKIEEYRNDTNETIFESAVSEL